MQLIAWQLAQLISSILADKVVTRGRAQKRRTSTNWWHKRTHLMSARKPTESQLIGWSTKTKRYLTLFKAKIASHLKADHPRKDIQTRFFAPVTLTLTRWPSHMNLIYILHTKNELLINKIMAFVTHTWICRFFMVMLACSVLHLYLHFCTDVFSRFLQLFLQLFYNCYTVFMFALLVANWPCCINKFDLIWTF